MTRREGGRQGLARRTEVKVNGEQQVSEPYYTMPKGRELERREGFIFPGIWGTAAHKGGCGGSIRGGRDRDRGRSPLLPDKQKQNCTFKVDCFRPEQLFHSHTYT